MEEIFKNIKTLFFTYMSIIFLLFFAVLQSSQEVYDTALEQLNEIERLVASYDERAINSIISSRIPGSVKSQEDVYTISNLDLSVRFVYKVSDLDYSSLIGKFLGQTPTGFGFGVRNRDLLPDEFTKIDSVNDPIITLPPPQNIDSYRSIHNSTLMDFIIPTFSPEFTSVRVEAIEFEKNTYNSIEMVNTSEIQGYKIFDQLSLIEEASSDSYTCQMKLVKTAVTDNYAYLCSISGFVYDGTSYSEARILIPAGDDPTMLKKNELMDLYGVPKRRRIAFEDAYTELFEATEAYAFLDFEKIKAILESEKSRNPSKLSIFGAEIDIVILTRLIFPILIMICLYIYLHLKEAKRRVSNSIGKWDDYDVPWIGIYAESINRSAIFAQLIVFPIMLMGVIHLKSPLDTALLLSWCFFIGLLFINLYNYRVIVNLRLALHDNSITGSQNT